MPVFQLGKELAFPPPEEAEPGGLLAVGGDLEPEPLLLAYSLGIFPWYDEELPILWHSPDPRMVLRPGELRVSRSLRKVLRAGRFELALDTAFEQVIRACAESPRPGAPGTWITEDMITAYLRLHELGFAHSAESWRAGELVGGVYGVSLGAAFFGESMFANRTDASKVAFAVLVRQLEAWQFHFVDCQVYTDHTAGLGARGWSRADFLNALEHALELPTRRGRWQLSSEAQP